MELDGLDGWIYPLFLGIGFLWYFSRERQSAPPLECFTHPDRNLVPIAIYCNEPDGLGGFRIHLLGCISAHRHRPGRDRLSTAI